MIPANEQSLVISKVFETGLVCEDDTASIFYDVSKLKAKLKSVNRFFSEFAPLHTAAVKTNPVAGILTEIVKSGHGLEAASIIEVKMALKAGCKPNKIVFDSPAKTQNEIDWCVNNLKGATVNANCLEELYRYPAHCDLNLGLRINVQRSSGSADFLDVSNEVSKFGEPASNVEGIFKAAKDYPSLNTLHIHQGSQNKNISVLLSGVKQVVDLAEIINDSLGKNQITTIDIGGGYAVNYTGGDEWDIAEFYEPVEELFKNTRSRFKVITELGRYYHAHAGFVAAKCEYVLRRGDVCVAVVHAGADLFLRECYVPNARSQTFHVLNSNFEFKGSNYVKDQNDLRETSIAGPLCFGGDFPARIVQLPNLDSGDWVVFNDAGANSLALWSMHCSRPAPVVILYDLESNRLEVVKRRQTHDDVMRFWE